jgi:hypothetical protein
MLEHLTYHCNSQNYCASEMHDVQLAPSLFHSCLHSKSSGDVSFSSTAAKTTSRMALVVLAAAEEELLQSCEFLLTCDCNVVHFIICGSSCYLKC